jgi:outer membrane protein
MKQLFLYLLSFACFPVYAQELTIDELWENTNTYQKVLQAKTTVEMAELNVKVNKGRKLPLVYAEGNLQRNLIIPSTPVPAIAFNPNAEPGEMTVMQFATDWSSKGGLQFSMDIFNPNNNALVKVADLEKKAAELDHQLALKEFKKAATAAYAKVVISSKQYEEAIQDTLRYKNIVDIAMLRNASGRASQIELNKAQQEFINKQTQLAEAYKVLEAANLDLSKFIDVEKYATISTAIESIVSRLQADGSNQEVEILKIEKDKIQVRQNNLFMEALPALSLNAYYGSQYFNRKLDLFQRENWYGNSYVNVGIRLPISEAIDRSVKKKQLALEMKIAESKLNDLLQDDEIMKKKQAQQIAFALKSLNNAKAVEQLSEGSLKLISEQYEAGKILISELNQELSLHFKNKQNVWQAEFDYLNAVLNSL